MTKYDEVYAEKVAAIVPVTEDILAMAEPRIGGLNPVQVVEDEATEEDLWAALEADPTPIPTVRPNRKTRREYLRTAAPRAVRLQSGFGRVNR